jgi:hypothetical protein
MKKLICLIIFIISLFIGGCAGIGEDKRMTLVPDSISMSFGQSRYREEAAAYRGFVIGAQWNLK